MNYLDTNFIAALHFNIQNHTPTAERYVRKTTLPFVVSGLAELEARRMFIHQTKHLRSEQWQNFARRLDGGGWLRYPVGWDAATRRTVELVERFGVHLNAGTLDTMHVALAQLSGCTWFLSFDTNSNARTLAASARLKVYPPLTATEKGRVVH